jgi:Ser-tRNA(Ala) deacylase AlaX
LAELLFREDPYLKACEATVVAVSGDAVELDRTVFYPLGGGQAGDTGKLGAWRVLDTEKVAQEIPCCTCWKPGQPPSPG